MRLPTQTHFMHRRSFLRSLFYAGAGCALLPRLRANTTRIVEAATKPGSPWVQFPTRTLEDLPGFSGSPDGPLTAFGGLAARRSRATGFFRTEKIDGRWWIIDPEGALFINKGVVSVRTTKTDAGQAALLAKFGDKATWARKTSELLRETGFNGVGSWSELNLLNQEDPHLVTTRIWSFCSSFGKRLGLTFQQPGHTGYKGNAIPVFDPGFEAFADDYARQFAKGKDDPWLLGHFTDNELPLTREVLADFLQAPNEAGRTVAETFLKERHGPNAGASDITDTDSREFLGKVVEQYHRVVCTAIRKYDPNHLILGPRFHSEKTKDTLGCPEIFRACGPYLDIVSANYYRAWTPDAEKIAMWERESGKPILISEWYAKGADSGMANNGGAGWLVRTQAERGMFYQNFALALLESRICVGWHWFKYSDNDPTDTDADPSNLDSNKGIVTSAYEPYAALLDAMKPLNDRAYALIEYFDRKSA